MTQKVIIVGELHQDLFYKTSAYTDLIEILAKNLKSINTAQLSPEELKKVITKIIDDNPKKIPGESFIRRGGNGNNSSELFAKLKIPIQLMTTVGLGADWMYPELKQLGVITDTVLS